MVRFHGIYLNINGLISGQIIQHTLYDFKLRLQVDQTIFNKVESERLIVSRLKSQLGDINVQFEYLDEIPRGPGGKFRAVISELPRS